MRKTTEARRWRVVGMSEAGMNAVAIGRTLDMPPGTVRGILARYRANPEGIKDHTRSGRPRITTRREDRCLTRDVRRHRFQNVRVLRYRWEGLHGARVSHRTVSRRLNRGCLRAIRPLKKLLLTVRHRRARLQGVVVMQVTTSDTAGGCTFVMSQGSTFMTTMVGSMCGGQVVSVSILPVSSDDMSTEVLPSWCGVP